MGLLRCQIANKKIAIVRNPKCASTTAMSYLAQIMWNAPPTELQNKQSFHANLGPESYIARAQGIEVYINELKESDIRIALYRDPVSKFLSGWYHSIFELSASKNLSRNGTLTLDEFLDNYSFYMQNENVHTHCRTNTALLGPDKSIYTHIIRAEDINKELIPVLEKLSNQRLVPVHLRKTKEISITDEQRRRIEYFMRNDYVNGWI